MAELIVHNPPRAALKASGYIGSPEGDIELTENDKTYNVSSFASATVKIPEEEKTVTPSAVKQEITPDNGLLNKVTVLPASLEERTVTPTTEVQTITPAAPYIGLSKVTINSSGVTVINADTVPESANWDGEIPTTYAGQTGEKGEIAFWNGELWYLYNVATLGQTTYYHWDKVAVTEDLEAKMDLAPLNPTAEQIAALPVGQVYGDTANHKGTIKGGQSFYDSAYIDENYRRTFIDNEYNPPYRVPSSVNDFQIGDMWVNTGQMRSFTLVSISTSDNFKHYNWKPENIVFIKIPNQPQVGDEFPSRTIDSEKWIYNPTWFIGDIVFNEKQGTGVSERLWTLRNLIVSVTSLITCSYKWQEISIPENTYTKNEIDTMIGDIESLLSEV